MKDIALPKEVLERIKELKVTNCILTKDPQKEFNYLTEIKKESLREFFCDDNDQRGFVIEVFLMGKI